MPLQATSGAASYDGFGGGVAVEPVYIEQIFSTYLYTGNGSTQTITNGIDLAGKGGMVWQKVRTDSGSSCQMFDTARGIYQRLSTAQTNAQLSWSPYGVTAFGSTGFTIADTSGGDYGCNGSPGGTYAGNGTYVSWTFRKQPKFFDIQTWTGNSTVRTISHNLGSVPGCIIVKSVSAGGNSWYVYHRSLDITSGKTIALNLTNAAFTNGDIFNSTLATATEFTIGIDSAVNNTGVTNIAYIFAHDAGGFGLTGTDNVISCGSFTNNGSGAASVTLGYEPQWVVIKNSQAAEGWLIADNMRGMPVGSADAYLQANSSAAEASYDYIDPTATGFNIKGLNSSQTYIYIAIRRGPMKVPTTGTSVFAPLAVNNATGTVNTTNFPIDLQMQFYRPGGISPGTSQWIDRLRGFSSTSTDSGTRLYTTGTQAEAATAIGTLFNNTGFSTGASWANVSMSYNNLRRAPSFFDVVCYTGTGSARTLSHNLAVVPEMAIIKCRTAASTTWNTYHTGLGYFSNGIDLQLTDAVRGGGPFSAAPTATLFTPQTGGGSFVDANASGDTYVAYLFATCSGVSKVGTYTGTGALQTVNCGFTGGARFVLIKRTDSTGDWWTYDSARGISSGNDPYLFLNSTAAEVTSTNYVDTDSTGFKVTAAAPAGLNASGGTYIFLAIA